MKVELKSNGTQHEIPSKIWEQSSANFKSNYRIISNADAVATEQTAVNTVEKTGTKKKKTEEPETGANPE